MIYHHIQYSWISHIRITILTQAFNCYQIFKTYNETFQNPFWNSGKQMSNLPCNYVTKTQLMLCEKQNTSHFHVCYNSTSRLQAIQTSKKCKQSKHIIIQQKTIHSLTSTYRRQLFCISSQDKNSRFSFLLFPIHNFFTATRRCLNE